MVDQTAQQQLSWSLKEEARREGFEPVGIARLPGSARLKMRTAALERWLAAGHEADMGWMAAPRRKDASLLLDGATSLLAVGLNYHVEAERTPGRLAIARYGWGRDYHRVVSQRLKRLGRWLEAERPGTRWRACVDADPLLDKAWAEEAGLGWIGKHSNVIHGKQGSWMVIGHLLCDLDLDPDPPATPLCGRCSACMDACPTHAIREPFVVDSRLCLSYHTIENRSAALPETIAKALGPWVAGCDICQDVCPWNQGPLPSSEDPELQPREWMLNLSREQALSWDDNTWADKLRGSALRRIKPWMWRRNATAAEPNGMPSLNPSESE
ncbi:MAG: tRNA epoxyqueuosine(34) reductase QueG [Synechococcus sp.]|nr:tRNA epoxyqueuosine(34) reductase QueG [Synechococcus sp.]